VVSGEGRDVEVNKMMTTLKIVYTIALASEITIILSQQRLTQERGEKAPYHLESAAVTRFGVAKKHAL